MNHKTFNVAALSVFVVTTVFLGAVIFWPDSPKNVEAGTTVQPAAMPSAPIEPISPAQPAVLVKTDPHDDDFEQLNEAVSYASEYMAVDTANEFPVIEISSPDSGGSSDYTASQSAIGDSFAPFSYDVSTLSSSLSSGGNTSSSSSSASSSSSGGSSGSSGGASGGGSSSGDSSQGDTTQPGDGTTNTQPDTPTDNSGTTPSSGSTTSGGGIIPSVDLTKPNSISSIFLYPNEIRQNRTLLPLSVAMENLLKYDAFWYAQLIAREHPQAWRTLRSQYPEKLAMHYFTPLQIGPKDVSFLDYEYVNQYHPEWILLKDEKNASFQDYRRPEKRMRWNPDNPEDFYYNCFFLDIGNEDFQRWAVDQFIDKLDPISGDTARIRYSGIVADNVLLTVWHTLKTKQYPNWKYAASASLWNHAYFSYLKKLHDALKKKGYILIVNHTTDYSSNRDGDDWQTLMNIVDGMADEEALGAPLTVWGGDKWEWSIRHHEETLDKGLYDWWIFIPDTSDPNKEYQQFLYIYCSFLLTKKQGLSLFGTVRRKDGVELNPWNVEYTLPLGNPLGERYQQDGCWFRDYQYGKIVVNPSSSRCTIDLSTERYTYDWRARSSKTQISLDPVTATILLPTNFTP
jgi:hypothetical protein